jgi:hypothetical protein
MRCVLAASAPSGRPGGINQSTQDDLQQAARTPACWAPTPHEETGLGLCSGIENSSMNTMNFARSIEFYVFGVKVLSYDWGGCYQFSLGSVIVSP